MTDTAIIQEWSCYVGSIDAETVELVMSDVTTDRGDAFEIGTFPKTLLEHLEPKPGQYVTVRIVDDGTIMITNTVASPETKAQSESDTEDLLRLLAKLQGDHGEGTDVDDVR